MAAAALTALGIVFGDLGTSPLYTLQTVVQTVGVKFTPPAALGILSLIFWALVITISAKYCLFVMRATTMAKVEFWPSWHSPERAGPTADVCSS
jgi:K+ transporter